MVSSCIQLVRHHKWDRETAGKSLVPVSNELFGAIVQDFVDAEIVQMRHAIVCIVENRERV